MTLTKKISHPVNKENAIGAAGLTDYFIVPHMILPEFYIKQEVEKIRIRLKEIYRRFIGDREPESLEGKTVIVIDDGIATGNTLMGTVKVLRKCKTNKFIIAVPVESKSAVNKLSSEVDEVIALLIPEGFHGVLLNWKVR